MLTGHKGFFGDKSVFNFVLNSFSNKGWQTNKEFFSQKSWFEYSQSMTRVKKVFFLPL